MKTYKGFNKDMTCRGFQYEDEEKIKSDTWYWLENGEFVEVSED